jgi:putative transposase
VQGDGEISLTALETRMQEVLIQVVLHKQKKFQWPHHVAQRGNHREPVFFGPEDYRFYRRLIATAGRRADAQIWAYCLMPNHVHLIVTPADEDGLRATFVEAHRRYTRAINARFHWRGHLFQGRFGAAVMAEPHLLAAARYIMLNPVVAGPVSRDEDWP